MAAPSLTYTLTNGVTADATQVMQNLNDLLNGYTDGTKDLSISALTCAGTATLNGHINLGNSSADDLTITASLASSLPIKTTNTYNIGSATLGLAGVYFGTGDTDTARIVSAALAASRTYTLPDAGGAADFVMTAGTQTIAGAKTFSTQAIIKGTATNDDAASGYVGEYLEQTRSDASPNSLASTTAENLTANSLDLTAGDWDIEASVGFTGSATALTVCVAGISTTSATLPGSGTLYNRVQDTVSRNLTTGDLIKHISRVRVSISGNTSYYLVVSATFAGGGATCSAYGRICARRVR